MKKAKPRPPTEYQTAILRRIDRTGRLQLTYVDGKEHYADGDGVQVDGDMARRLIARGFLVPQRDSMFDMKPQSWKARGFLHSGPITEPASPEPS